MAVKVSDLTTESAPASTDILLIADPTTGVAKKITVSALKTYMDGLGGGGDVTAPTIVSAVASTGNQVTFTFSESVTVTTAGWSFKLNGGAWSISSVSGSGSTWTFTMASSATNTSTLLYSYSSTTGSTVDTSSNELASVTDISITNSIPSNQLSTPTLTATAVSPNAIYLSWGAITNATEYEIRRATVSDFTGETVVIDNQTGTSYTDNGLTSGTLYYYRIKAQASGFTDSGWGTDSETTQTETFVTWNTIDAQLETYNSSKGIRKIAGQAAAWGDVAYSNQQLSSGQRLIVVLDYNVTFSSYMGVGLITSRTGDITGGGGWPFGLLTYPGPTISQYESVTQVNDMGTAGTLAANSWWCMYYDGSTIKYQKSTDNGASWTTQYTSAVTPSGSYYIGFDGYSENAPVLEIKIV